MAPEAAHCQGGRQGVETLGSRFLTSGEQPGLRGPCPHVDPRSPQEFLPNPTTWDPA